MLEATELEPGLGEVVLSRDEFRLLGHLLTRATGISKVKGIVVYDRCSRDEMRVLSDYFLHWQKAVDIESLRGSTEVAEGCIRAELILLEQERVGLRINDDAMRLLVNSVLVTRGWLARGDAEVIWGSSDEEIYDLERSAGSALAQFQVARVKPESS